ncbi:MAG: ferritin family protein, partial [Candidatus Omnitrophota bacterium]
EEEGHKRIFQGLLSSVAAYERVAEYSEEYFLYLDAVAKQQVFSQRSVDDIVAKVANENDAVNIGIQAEKDSILFYDAFCDTLPEKEKPLLSKIITEEKKHLRKLLKLKTSLRAEV